MVAHADDRVQVTQCDARSDVVDEVITLRHPMVDSLDAVAFTSFLDLLNGEGFFDLFKHIVVAIEFQFLVKVGHDDLANVVLVGIGRWI